MRSDRAGMYYVLFLVLVSSFCMNTGTGAGTVPAPVPVLSKDTGAETGTMVMVMATCMVTRQDYAPTPSRRPDDTSVGGCGPSQPSRAVPLSKSERRCASLHLSILFRICLGLRGPSAARVDLADRSVRSRRVRVYGAHAQPDTCATTQPKSSDRHPLKQRG